MRDAARVLTELGGGPLLYPLLLLLVLRHHALTASTTYLPLILLGLSQAVESVISAPLDISSGHTATAIVGWGLVARELLNREVHGRSAVMASVATIPVVVAATRVGLGSHSVGDVVTGAAVGVALLGVALRVLRIVPPAPARPFAIHERRWWVWALVAGSLALTLLPILLSSEDARLKDLSVYQGAGGTAGQGTDVYAFRNAFAMPFTYPPFAALLSEPLGRIPIGVVQVGWTVLTLSAALVVARVVLSPISARIGTPLTFAALLASSPMRSHLRFGQVGILLVAAVGLDLLRKPRRPGLGIGAAIAIKLTPAVLLPWLAVVARPRMWLTAAWATGLSLLGLALL